MSKTVEGRRPPLTVLLFTIQQQIGAADLNLLATSTVVCSETRHCRNLSITVFTVYFVTENLVDIVISNVKR